MSNRRFTVDMDTTKLAHCCGILETGNYLVVWSHNKNSGITDGEDLSDLSDEEKEELKLLWTMEINYYLKMDKRPMLFTLVKYPGHKEYENQCLVDAINEHTGALDCGSSVNPGTGNTVTVYMIYPPKKGTK